MSDSVQPHRWQPTRLPRPWDSPGKNTGVGCHFVLQCMKVKSESEVAQSCPTLSDPMDCSLPWEFPGKSTGVGCHCLLHLRKAVRDNSSCIYCNVLYHVQIWSQLGWPRNWVWLIPSQTSLVPSASLVAQLVKNPPTMQEILVQLLGWEDPLEKR